MVHFKIYLGHREWCQTTQNVNYQSGEETFLVEKILTAHTTPGGTIKLEPETGLKSSATTKGGVTEGMDRACNRNFHLSSPKRKALEVTCKNFIHQ